MHLLYPRLDRMVEDANMVSYLDPPGEKHFTLAVGKGILASVALEFIA